MEKIQSLSLDLETFSDVDLQKCGVYKYAQSPNFEILLFGVSVNGGEVVVYDLAQGDTVPMEIVEALTDDTVTKWAYNAAFERICLSVWLQRNYPAYFHSYSIDEDTVGDYLDPSAWKCSMIWAAYMGLPLSLAGAGTVLGLEEQKLKEGKDLIRYFCVPCKPTKVNGGRTRNLPEHDMEKWNTFIFYNKRDVEVEMSIQDMELLYDDIPDTLSQLIRTAFVPRPGMKFVVADFSAIEARVLSYLAKENWRTEVFANNGDIYCASASAMFGVPVEKHGVNGNLRQKGKIAELALGYGGSVGALKAMGALDMGLSEEELQPLVDSWRAANPNIVRFWWEVDRCVKETVKKRVPTETHGIRFIYQSGMLFIKLPSGRQLSYVKPRMGENRFGGESVTYEGVGGTKKWERIESYGPKFVENIVQAISRDILAHSMRTLSHCFICGHVHDELIIECGMGVSLDAICEQMGRTPAWIPGLLLRADGYECSFYKKD